MWAACHRGRSVGLLCDGTWFESLPCCSVQSARANVRTVKHSKRLPNSYFVTFSPQTTHWFVVCLYNVKPCPHLRSQPCRNGVAFTSAWDVGVDATEWLWPNGLCPCESFVQPLNARHSTSALVPTAQRNVFWRWVEMRRRRGSAVTRTEAERMSVSTLRQNAQACGPGLRIGRDFNDNVPITVDCRKHLQLEQWR